MLDNTDTHIISELVQNSRITMKSLGEKVHLTGQATATRVAKLEDDGVIEGYTIKVNKAKLGYSVHTFINVFVKGISHEMYLSFINKQEKYVINNYKISGDSCFLLECMFPSNEELDEFLVELNKYVNYRLSIVIR